MFRLKVLSMLQNKEFAFPFIMQSKKFIKKNLLQTQKTRSEDVLYRFHWFLLKSVFLKKENFLCVLKMFFI